MSQFTVVSITDDAIGEIHPIMAFEGQIRPVREWGFGPNMDGSFIAGIEQVEATSAEDAMEQVARKYDDEE